MSDHYAIVNEYARRAGMAQAERLEREAAALLACGYAVDELTVVYGWWNPHLPQVWPQSMLEYA